MDPAPAMAEPGWERYLFGVEVVAVPALAALAAWLVWLIGEGEVTGADGYGSFVLVLGVATVAGLIGRWMGAPAQRRWPNLANSIWWWRALHAPAGLAFVVAIVIYAILLQPPGSP